MNASTQTRSAPQLAIEADAYAACARIAPNWPLDRLIAVNPWWNFTELPFATAIGELQRLGGVATHSRVFAAEALRKGTLRSAHVAAAIERTGAPCNLDAALAAATRQAPAPTRFPLVTDRVDARRDIRHGMSWNDFVVHQISQQCAAFFDADQARWRPPTSERLYALWRRDRKSVV